MTQFYGSMTIENAEEIGLMIYEKLKGKQYTFASHNSGFSEQSPLFLDVRVNQSLSDHPGNPSFHFWMGENGEYAGFNFNDSYGVWGISTSVNNPNIRVNQDSHMKYYFDPDYNAPYVVIDFMDIRIVHRAPAGHILVWVISLERE